MKQLVHSTNQSYVARGKRKTKNSNAEGSIKVEVREYFHFFVSTGSTYISLPSRKTQNKTTTEKLLESTVAGML